MALVFSAFILGRPPLTPPDERQRIEPLASYTRYTVEDFVSSMH